MQLGEQPMGQAMQQQYEKAQDRQGNKLAQSKGRDNRKWSRWRQGCVIEVPSLARSTSPFREGVEHNAHHEGHIGPPYSPHTLTNTRCRDSTMGHLRAVTEPVQFATLGDGHRTRTIGNPWGRSLYPCKCSGQSPQPNWRLP